MVCANEALSLPVPTDGSPGTSNFESDFRHSTPLPAVLYKGRARIEQAVGKLKRFKRIALRCEKTAQNYGSFVALALGIILIKSIHTAQCGTSQRRCS
ncbi:transposase [Bradyrhizobium sp. KBS0727]|nr:transposase [Bradyrhizobium sp. KBS0725]QDW48498.1 transposase [Bradyrhizobium sp. KBS0727]